jgi:hypothetical protein
LEDLCSSWLKKEEQEWCLKSRALWIKVGDNNTKLFHQFANYRRNLNTIWEIKDEEGNMASSFKDKAKLGVRYFSKSLPQLGAQSKKYKLLANTLQSSHKI